MSARAILTVCLSLLAACSSGPADTSTGFGTTPFATVTGDSGNLDAAMYSSPDPIARVSSVEIVVTDAASGAPVDGLSVAIVPWMPSMGHGSSTVPTITAQGGGVYVATNLILFMPGEWQLRVSANGPVSDTFVATVEVP
jgi:nitrogen fixation protein FixH